MNDTASQLIYASQAEKANLLKLITELRKQVEELKAELVLRTPPAPPKEVCIWFKEGPNGYYVHQAVSREEASERWQGSTFSSFDRVVIYRRS